MLPTVSSASCVRPAAVRPAVRTNLRSPSSAKRAVKAAASPQSVGSQTQCLYAVLGGEDAVTAAVDIFYVKVLNDKDLAPFFEGIDMKRQKAKQVMFMAYALGGSEAYTGRDLGTAHKGLKGLTHMHFDRVLKHFSDTLVELGVQEEVVQRAGEVVESTRPQFNLAEAVVSHPSA